MKRITRYISWQICQAILLTLLAFAGIEMLMKFIGELRHLGSGDYNLQAVIHFVILSFPLSLYSLFPMIALLGALFGLGLMASSNELVVIRAAGVSIRQIAIAVLFGATILVVGITYVGEVIAPRLAYVADTQKAIAKSDGQALQTRRGLWMKDDKTFIHVASLPNSRHLQGVTLYQFNDNQQLERVIYAKDAIPDQDGWLLQSVRETKFLDQRVIARESAEQTTLLHLQPYAINAKNVLPEEMSLVDLYQSSQLRAANGIDNRFYQLVFWQRVWQPFATLIMILLAIPFVFGPLRHKTMGSRIVYGLLAGFSFYLLNQFFAPLSLLLRLSPIVAVTLPLLTFLVLASLLLRKVG